MSDSSSSVSNASNNNTTKQLRKLTLSEAAREEARAELKRLKSVDSLPLQLSLSDHASIQSHVPPAAEYCPQSNVNSNDAIQKEAHSSSYSSTSSSTMKSIDPQSTIKRLSLDPLSNNSPSATYYSPSTSTTSKPTETIIPTSPSPSTTLKPDPTADRIERIFDMLKNVEKKDADAVKLNGGGGGDNANLNMMSVMAQPNALQMTAISQANMSSTKSVFDGVKAKIIGQQMEIEEKSKTLSQLREEMNKLRDIHLEQTDQLKKDMKTKLSTQRKEYEIMIKRHLTFIDKLLGEKDELSKRCEVLSDEVKAMDKGFKEKLKQMEEHQMRELKQQRELWQAAEKIKRDKWIAEKTKAIKDQTVKGLEPEIQRMLAQHKVQLRQVEERFKEDLTKEKAVIAEASQRQIDQLRDKMIAERQRACEEEREYARQRYQKQLERDEMEFQQQKRKLQSEFEEQKHTLLEEHRHTRHQEQLDHKKTIDSLMAQIEKSRSDGVAGQEELRRKHQNEMMMLHERLKVEKEEWQDAFLKRQEGAMRERDKLLKEKLIQERDAELELIVQRLESETNSNASDIYRRHRMDIEKIKAEHAEEIKQLRDQHSLAVDKVIASQAEFRKCDEENKELKRKVIEIQNESEAKENSLRHQKIELSRLKADEHVLAENIRIEFAAQLRALDEQVAALQGRNLSLMSQIESIQTRHKEELEDIMKEKESSLNIVEERVRQTLAFKDDIVKSLRQQIDDLTMRNSHLNQLLEKQREEFLALQSYTLNLGMKQGSDNS
ncbi:Centrosomal protein of 131 kDa [Blyttiomyces sp. JEL0837]|nr:Centrosomal protein of 131 kDa [Blyttiomyces sp. JEL0837]